jgi:hypothetical protein
VARIGGTRIPISLRLAATPVGVGGDVLRDVIATKGVNDHERGSSLACKGRFMETAAIRVGFGRLRSSGPRFQFSQDCPMAEFDQVTVHMLSWDTIRSPEVLYMLKATDHGYKPGLIRSSLDGGGDTRDLSASSVYLKPSERSIYLGLPVIRGMVKDRRGTDVHKERWSPGDGRLAKQGNVAESSPKKALVQEEAKGWVMEVLKGVDAGHVEVPDDDDDGMREFDLEEEDTSATSKVMAIAVFFLRKSYSIKYLFYDMLKVT